MENFCDKREEIFGAVIVIFFIEAAFVYLIRISGIKTSAVPERWILTSLMLFESLYGFVHMI